MWFFNITHLERAHGSYIYNMTIDRTNSGRPGGNPDIGKIAKTHSTGPKTPEGKLKSLITTNTLIPTSNSKVLNMFKFCNKCPLREIPNKTVIKGMLIDSPRPARCSLYVRDDECKIDQGEMIAKLQAYYKIGELDGDTLKLQEALTYGMLENAEIAKQAEMVQYRKPGLYTAKFQELAGKNMESVNKLKYGEKHSVLTADMGKISADDAIKVFIKKRENGKDKESGEEQSQS